MPAPKLTDLVGPPPDAREFTMTMRPGLADCAPSGRIRLDALARWLQDVAYADVEDAGVAGSAVWVVRRTRIQVLRFPRFAEHFEVRTFCSGIGRMWAERRTTIRPEEGSGEPCVEAVALWVHLDPETWRPMPFADEEIALYGDAAMGRRITARLRHPPAPADAASSQWTFRATECDLAGHVNNSNYWQPLEEEFLLQGHEPSALDAEMEFRTPSQPGRKLMLRDGVLRWIVDPEGATHASAVVVMS
ncbi:MAG TPA: acyl-ACP thioesterase domain-containing protein [Solirubrobacteraceae bacterium]|jgi:acyl-ACP thioesterase